MNVGKSIKLCLIKKEISRDELAARIHCTPTYVGKLCSKKTCGGSMLDKLSSTFEMSTSEFIALGE